MSKKLNFGKILTEKTLSNKKQLVQSVILTIHNTNAAGTFKKLHSQNHTIENI